MAYNAGTIFFTVEAETQKLLDGSKDLNTSLRQTSGEMKKLDDQSKTLNTSFSKLATVIKTVIAATALRQAADMVQSFQEMSERIQMATSSTEEFESVQKRLLETSNGTYRRLSEAQELYILTADSLRSMGYSTKQAMDIQDSMSYSFVKNATSVERADAAISAFTKSVNMGKVAADQWETIVSSIPSVIDDIALAAGKTSAEIRLLGSAGKLTANQLTEGLRTSLDENSKAAEGMSNNLTDASVRVENALTAMLVKFESSTGVIQSFTEGIIKAADYVIDFSGDAEGMASVIKTVEVAGASLASVVAGRLIMSMAAYTVEQTKAVATTISKSNADKLAAQGALRRTAVEKQLAMAVLAAAKADLDAAKVGTYAHTVATKNLTAARTAAIAATNANAIAQANMNRVVTIGTVAINGLKSAMAFLGGPAGLVLLAASAIYTFSSATEEAKTPTDLLSESIDRLGTATLSLRKVQLEDSIGDMDKIGGDISKATVRVEYLKKQLQEFPNSKKAEIWSRELLELGSQIEVDSAKLKSYKDRLSAVNAEIEKRKNGGTDVKSDGPDLIDEKKVSDGEKAIAKLTESIKLAKLEGKELAEATSLSGLNSDEVSKYGDQIKKLSGELFDLDQAADNADSIKELEQNLKLAALSGSELAQAQAVLSLNEYATPDQIESVKSLSTEIYKLKEAQKEKVSANNRADKAISSSDNRFQQLEKEREAIKADYDKRLIDKQTFNDAMAALDAKNAAEKKKEQESNVNRVGSSSDAMGLGIDKESRIQELQALHDAELISEQEFNAQKLSIMQNYNQQVMALNEERFRQESEGNAFVMDSLDALGNASTNVFSGMLSGTMTAMDAVRAFGNAIMNEAINALVQMGIQQVKNQIIGKSMAAANVATAAASGAAMAAAYAPAATAVSIATQGGAVTAGMSAVSTATPIMNTILSGGRQYGGPVSSNGMYRINENGAPEVFNAANGQQYMLPNTRGEVVSNKDSTGGGAVNIIVNVNSDGSVSTNGSGQMAQFGKEIGQMVEAKYKQMEAQSMRQGGSLWRSQQKGK
ncbi:tape measure protein [Vibrio casei]|nr:tape measure protein [Vibrio casei]SJN24468.1 Phage tail length tape-measure protein 1 [Vibrio casei]